MLTIKGNLKNHNLGDLCKYLIKEDIINFSLSTVGGGFTEAIADKVIAKLTLSKDRKILVINDITLQMVNKLLAAGYKKENIYLAFGKWTRAGLVSDDTLTYNIMKAFIKANIKESLKIISLKEIFVNELKIDGVIANPPYGADGNKVTETIINKVAYKEFINLLPLKDYTLETGKHIDFNEITTLPPHSFSDADILTHAVRILKASDDKIKTEADLCSAAFTVDKPMLKFMKDNLAKNHYAFDNIKKFGSDCEVNKTFVYHHFDAGSAHTCGMPRISSEIPKNKYNLQNIDESVNGVLYGVDKAIRFKTSVEKDCLVHIYKIARNFINRMLANQFIGIRDSAACWPKVDLTNTKWLSMTTEAEIITAIMKEINNSTDEAIKAVLDTMNKDYFIGNDEDINRLFGEYLN